MSNSSASQYKKVLSIYDLILSNIGHIVGAGVFVLIGKILNIAGKTAWLSVLLSGIFIYFISDSYIKVYNKYLSNDSEYLAIKVKYGKLISNISIITTCIATILIIYIVVLGFGSYTNIITNNYITSFTASLLGLLSAVIINIYGIELTTDINNIFTIGGIFGLFLLIFLGCIYFYKHWLSTIQNFKLNSIHDINILNILYAAFIFIFAYGGFELTIRLSAESESESESAVDLNADPDIINQNIQPGINNVHIALKNSIVIIIIIYTLLMLIMIGIFGNGRNSCLASSLTPLSVLINKLTNNTFIIKYIELSGMVLTWNTILLSITYGSRLITEYANNINIYTLTLDKKLDTNLDTNPDTNLDNKIINLLKDINIYTQTPIYSIIFIGIIVLLLILIKLNIITSTIVSNACVIMVMFLVYLSS